MNSIQSGDVINDLFAYRYLGKLPVNAWPRFDIRNDYRRMHLSENPDWQVRLLFHIYCQNYEDMILDIR